MKTAFLLLLALSLFGSAAPALACSPAPDWPPSPQENLDRSEIAFIGTVASVMQDKSANGDYRISFEVEESYKGMVSGEVTVRTRSSSAACGYDDGYEAFEKGKTWVIFARTDASGGYSTDSLSLNAPYASVSAAREALEKAGIDPLSESPIACTMEYAPMCGTAPDGTVRTYGNACTLRASKATLLYSGECRATDAMPASDLSVGDRGDGVSWLQRHLIERASGAAAAALQAVGPTGYFGRLTQAALAELQSVLGISPAQGFFGPKTRAALSSADAKPTATFTGTISAVDTGCFADGVCSVTVGGKEVVVLTGMRIDPPPVGSLRGVDSIGDLEGEIGSEAEVYAARTSDGSSEYTLYGDPAYYVKVLGK